MPTIIPTNILDASCGISSTPESLAVACNFFYVSDLEVCETMKEFTTSNNRKGTIPSEIGLLTQATLLSIGFTPLRGPVPTSIFCLTNLEHLSISGSNSDFYVTMPSTLLKLSRLKSLSIRWGDLQGSIHNWLSGLSDLEKLELDRNQLSGSIPESLFTLTKLTDLIINRNKITGTISSSLSGLVRLKWLYLDNNQIAGTFPQFLLGMENLKHITVHQNPMSGVITDCNGKVIDVDCKVIFCKCCWEWGGAACNQNDPN
jgi:Leucine-rich repeat (LRR) protein